MKFRLSSSSLLLLALALSSSLTLAAQKPNAISVASVNGEEISQEAFVVAMRARLASGAKDSAAMRQQVREALILQTILARQGEKAKLDKNDGFQLQLKAYRDLMLAKAWQAQWLKDNPPSTNDLKQEYARVSKEAGQLEYRIRQVVVGDATAAQLIMDQLGSGKSLADLAQAYSIEPIGKKEGGLLPWINLTVLVPALREAVTQAKVGKVWPQPVQGPRGWHVLQVEETRPFKMPKLDDIKPQLTQAVSQAQLRQAMQDLAKKAKVELK